MKRLSLVFLIASCFILSCSDDSNDSDAGTNMTDETTVNPNYLAIDWNKTEILECRPDDGFYTLRTSAETNSIIPGSVLVVDLDTIGYVEIVEEVERKDDKTYIYSERGSLCDIFANMNFILSTTDEAQTAHTRSLNTPYKIYTPVKTMYQEDGKWVEIPETRYSTQIEEKWEWNKDNSVLLQKDNYKIWLPKANLSASLDWTLDLGFGEWTPVMMPKKNVKRNLSRALEVAALITGKADMNFKIQADVEGSVELKENEDELWIHNVFKPIRRLFIVEGVPVYVTLSADLFRGASLTMYGKITASAGVHFSTETKLGFTYNIENGGKPVNSFQTDCDFDTPTVVGKGHIDGKTWLYPRIHISLYDLAGPSFDIKPYLGTTVNGGFREDLLKEEGDYSAWTLTNNAGIDCATGLSLMFMNYERKHLDFGEVNAWDAVLYQSPLRLEFLDASPNNVVRNKKHHVNFSVYDINRLFNKENLTPLSQIVKFEASAGTLSSKYSIAKNGVVSVDWTPTSSGDSLNAILFDVAGNVLSMATFGPGDPSAELNVSEISGTWTCICYTDNGTIASTLIIILDSDGSATINGEDNWEGSWMIGEEDNISFSFLKADRLGWSSRRFDGVADNPQNPSRIEGTATFSRVGLTGNENYSKFKFIMTK